MGNAVQRVANICADRRQVSNPAEDVDNISRSDKATLKHADERRRSDGASASQTDNDEVPSRGSGAKGRSHGSPGLIYLPLFSSLFLN